VGLVVFAFCFGSVPLSFGGALMLAALMLAALFCALNAVLDYDEMGVGETYIAGLWFVALVVSTPFVLYSMGTIREFANK